MTGPVFIHIGGKERRLRYDINSAADMEEAMNGKSLLYTMTNPMAAGFYAIRVLLWGGLKHAERGLTQQRVGLMMQEYMDNGGRLEALIAKISEAIKLSKILGSEVASSDELNDEAHDEGNA